MRRVWTNGPTLGGFTADIEGGYQFGPARGTAAGPVPARRVAIRAWDAFGIFGYPARALPLAPTPGLELGVTSGDRDPADATLGTFRAPNPPGRYFGEANPFGPGNVAGVRPSVELHPAPALRLRARTTFFSRTWAADATYTLAPAVLRGPASGVRYLGAEPSLETGYAFGPHRSFTGFLSRLLAGSNAYFGANPPRVDVTFVEATLAMRW